MAKPETTVPQIPSRASAGRRTVALIGNPNTGKSTLFNALTGFRQRVGNYPGVTVEQRTGRLRRGRLDADIMLVDLPGAYSLAARSEDEGIVLDVLLGQHRGVSAPDAIVCVVDATNLARNLFLATQALELGRPVVVALTMTDVARSRGIHVDAIGLTRELEAPVVQVVATRRIGVDEVAAAIETALGAQASDRCPGFPTAVCTEIDGLRATLATWLDGKAFVSRAEAVQTLLDPGGFHELRFQRRCGARITCELVERRERIAEGGIPLIELEARVRYAWIADIVGRVAGRSDRSATSRTERVDRFLTHRVFGLGVFLLLMGICFQSLYAWAVPVMDGIDSVVAALGSWVSGWIAAGPLQSLVVDGVISGVGAVLVFLPQILILFLFLAVLEDCGYMARAAFLLDRWMSLIGLGGKSFIPLVSSFACAIPGIMATRTIEDRRERFVTMMIAPLMSCSARLPVYILLIGAFVPAVPLFGGLVYLQAATLFGMYLIGMLVAVPIALLLKATVLKGPPQSFLMELPTYKWPRPAAVLYRMYEQGREFCITAGTVIFAFAIIVWALGYYPHPASIAADHDTQRAAARADVDAGLLSAEALDAQLARIDRNESGAYLRHSVLGRMGKWIEPVVRPLGWDWRIGTAALAAFPARELVISTMGTIYNLGEDIDERSEGLRAKLQSATWPDGRPVFNLAVALSIMVFFALCCQCGSTLATIKRETNSWRWPIFAFTYMTALAYAAALITYQLTIRLV
jgi:ferrous iron transport protein B